MINVWLVVPQHAILIRCLQRSNQSAGYTGLDGNEWSAVSMFRRVWSRERPLRAIEERMEPICGIPAVWRRANAMSCLIFYSHAQQPTQLPVADGVGLSQVGRPAGCHPEIPFVGHYNPPWSLLSIYNTVYKYSKNQRWSSCSFSRLLSYAR